MRGLISFVLLLAMLFPLIYLAGSAIRTNSAIMHYSDGLLKIQRMRAAELEIGNAVSQVLGSAKGADSEARKLDASLKLISLESEWEGKMKREGIAADLWFGPCEPRELEGLKARMFAKKRAEKCNGLSSDFSSETIDLRRRIVPLSSAFLHEERGRLIVSKRGLSSLPQAELAKFISQRIYFAASLYSNDYGAAWVAAMPEGFG